MVAGLQARTTVVLLWTRCLARTAQRPSCSHCKRSVQAAKLWEVDALNMALAGSAVLLRSHPCCKFVFNNTNESGVGRLYPRQGYSVDGPVDTRTARVKERNVARRPVVSVILDSLSWPGTLVCHQVFHAGGCRPEEAQAAIDERRTCSSPYMGAWRACKSLACLLRGPAVCLVASQA